MTKTVAIVSGGMDSVTLLHKVVKEDGADHVLALSFNYGQRHKKELHMAADQCRRLGVRHEVIELGFLRPLIATSALTNAHVEVPEGHYAAESMKATVVPNRNMLMLSVAAAIAIAEKATRLAYGAHAGDHDIYPDCRKEFVHALAEAIRLADWHEVALFAPFLDITKADIVREGLALGVDYGSTWTCYKGGETACGKCGTCVERLEAFSVAGTEDPLPYEDREFWKAQVKAA